MNREERNSQEHEERLEGSRWWSGGYLAPALVVLFTIFWVLMHYWLIGWSTRDWEFGTMPYVPADSAFTSREVKLRVPPKQVILPPDLPGVPGGANVPR